MPFFCLVVLFFVLFRIFAQINLIYVMKKILLLCLALCAVVAVNAQDLPYSKYLDFSKKEFRDNNFKYDDYTNTWTLRKTSGFRATVNVLAIIADAQEDVRPSSKDYTISVQMGDEDKASFVKVIFYDNDTYHKVLTYIKDNGRDIVETSSGKLIKQQAFWGDYALELNMEQHLISRTSARTADYKTVKNVDESYNQYEFIIRTNVEPTSEYRNDQAAKQAKRDAKGKKKKDVQDLM